MGWADVRRGGAVEKGGGRGGWSRYMGGVEKRGWSWYEGEVHPKVVEGVSGERCWGRSYQMDVERYGRWLDLTGMDMVYGYVPWMWGRRNGEDEWGRFVYQSALLDVGDLIDPPPYEAMRKRLEELCAIKGGRGLEMALYNTPMVVMDGLGMEKFALEMVDHPGKLEDWMDRIDERVGRELEVVLEYPVEVVQFSQVFADKNGPMFSAECLDRFGFKYLQRRADRVHAENRLVAIHCDGDCRKLYQRIQKWADVFNGYEGTDFERDQGETKMGFRGSVPTSLLEKGTPESIKEFVRGLKGKHVIGSTHDTGDVPVENFVAMMDAARAM